MIKSTIDFCESLSQLVSSNTISALEIDSYLKELEAKIVNNYTSSLPNQEEEEKLVKSMIKLGRFLIKSEAGNSIWDKLISKSCEWHQQEGRFVEKEIHEYLIKNCFFNSSQALNLIYSSLIFVFKYQNVGDVNLFMSLIDSISKAQNKRLIILCTDRLRSRLGKVSGLRVTPIFLDNDIIYNTLNKVGYRLQKCLPGKICSVYRDNIPNKFNNSIIQKKVEGLDERKIRLGLSSDIKPAPPIYTLSDMHKYFMLFEDLNLKYKNTIIICPFTRALGSRYEINTVKSPWILGLKELISKAKAKGFTVFLNDVGDRRWQEAADYLHENDVKRHDIPLSQIVTFANLCGYVVTMRSGICELLRYSNSKLFIAYPAEIEYERFGLKSLTGAPLPEYTVEQVIDLDEKSSIENFLKLPLELS